ncbi:MAG: LysR family transcriptional regulator [Phycisphaerales bacterium]|nr:LysR family transcriptional regulator [Phycisphaerales bacterium]
MELTTLRHFKMVAQHGHMTRAARALGVTQPALSAMLKKLEKEVGAELMHRTGRGVQLTEAGRVFLVHAEDAIRRAELGVQAVRELVGLERGSIRVGGGATATTYLLPPVVSAVRAAHDGLRFYVREAGSNAVAAAVLSGELDLGIVTLPIGHPEAGELLKIPLVDDELRLILPPEDAVTSGGGRGARRARSSSPGGSPALAGLRTLARAGGARGFRWRDLEGVPIVAFEAGTAVRALVDEASARRGVVLDVVMELRSIESIKQMVAAGIGVGFVSRFALDEGEGLECSDGPIGRKLAIVRLNDRVPSPAVAAFERELVERWAKA